MQLKQVIRVTQRKKTGLFCGDGSCGGLDSYYSDVYKSSIVNTQKGSICATKLSHISLFIQYNTVY